MYSFFLEIAKFTCQITTDEHRLYQFLKTEYTTTNKKKNKVFVKMHILQKDNNTCFMVTSPNSLNISIPYIDLSYVNFSFFVRSILAYFFVQKKVLILHASALSFRNKGYVFAGKSGYGKTTLVNRIPHIPIYANDTAIIKILHSKIILHPSPFEKKIIGLCSKKPIPVNRIFFIKHSGENILHILPFYRQIEYLMDNLIHQSIMKFKWFRDTKSYNYYSSLRDRLLLLTAGSNRIFEMEFEKYINLKTFLLQVTTLKK